MRGAANQIQIKCCTGAALDNTNGPKLKQPGIAGGGAATGKRRLSLTASGRAIPEPERRWGKDAGSGGRGRNPVLGKQDWQDWIASSPRLLVV